MVYDWIQSEGGGGAYNPLNMGTCNGCDTITGNQYGGGAADYASPAASINGFVHWLNMPNYATLKSALLANNPQGAEAALIASPWAASHYGGSLSSAPLPGSTSAINWTSGPAGGSYDTTGNPSPPCQIHIPVVGCVWYASYSRALLGGILVGVGGLVMTLGLAFIGVYGLESSAARKLLAPVRKATGSLGAGSGTARSAQRSAARNEALGTNERGRTEMASRRVPPGALPPFSEADES
ncbi:MAG: hypothetical protein ACRDX8_12140 [Acidimicrobiales bacterium]